MTDSGDLSSDDELLAGLSAPARRALAGAGIVTLQQVSRNTKKQLLALHGVGPKAIATLEDALAGKGMSFSPDADESAH